MLPVEVIVEADRMSGTTQQLHSAGFQDHRQAPGEATEAKGPDTMFMTAVWYMAPPPPQNFLEAAAELGGIPAVELVVVG